MKNSHILLFKVKFVKSKQLPLEFEFIKPEEILIRAISEKPDIETKENYSWHIGNVSQSDIHYGSFAIGRKSLTPLSHYDIERKDFIDEVSETSPYTIVYYESVLGLLGIKRNYHLAPNESIIAKKIEQLLSSTVIVKNTITHVEVSNIKDPISFINKLKNAYVIKKFTVTFSGPNPFDADEHFHKPMSVYLQEAGGTEGKTIIDGETLDSEVLMQMTRSVAATGNNATARLRNSANEKMTTVSLKNNPAKIVVSPDLDEANIDQKMIEEYRKIRNERY
jgi:hypothetical protein